MTTKKSVNLFKKSLIKTLWNGAYYEIHGYDGYIKFTYALDIERKDQVDVRVNYIKQANGFSYEIVLHIIPYTTNSITKYIKLGYTVALLFKPLNLVLWLLFIKVKFGLWKEKHDIGTGVDSHTELLDYIPKNHIRSSKIKKINRKIMIGRLFTKWFTNKKFLDNA